MPTIDELHELSLEDARTRVAPHLFDARYYRIQAGLPEGADEFAHFFQAGAAAGLKPNVVFETSWYIWQNPGVARAGVNPLMHYALIGEPAGVNPSPLFDARWYADSYQAKAPLAHYLEHRFGPYSPIPEFDAAFYLDEYPDVAETRLDPFLHYLHFGFREFRKPSAAFEPKAFARRLNAEQRGLNPLVVLRAHPELAAARSASEGVNVFSETRANVRGGALFEPLLLPDRAGTPRACVLAYYLTQFHRTAENDAFWGEGFTEWTSLARGQPRFAGHYQPRIPERLGFYDLSDVNVMRGQAALARRAGISAFVFYYYDFGGRRVLEKPLEQFLAAPDIDIGFCLMWANENWTRRWDGAESEVLIEQTYDERDEKALAESLVRHFRDPRYLRLNGRPVLMVYRAGLIPDAPAALIRWRRLFAENFGEQPLFVMSQVFDDVDPRPLGFDAAIEFPPHKLTKGLPQVYTRLNIFDDGFEADAFAYDDLVDASLAEPIPEYPLIKTAVPSWDNDARRQGRGLTLVGATPSKYERWLGELTERAQQRPLFGAPLVCVNAWNEWSEGAYLEPDVHFGAAYLNATARALSGDRSRKAGLRVYGASPLLDAIARRFCAGFGFVASDAEPAANAWLEFYALGAPSIRTVLAIHGERDIEFAQRQREAIVVAADVSLANIARERLGRSASEIIVAAPLSAGPDSPEFEAFSRRLLQLIAPDMTQVSVALVNDGAGDVRETLQTIFDQDHPVVEVIVFDDIDTEASFRAIDDCARLVDRDATVAIVEERNWTRVLSAAQGDAIWVLNSGASADRQCLARLAAILARDDRVALAICETGTPGTMAKTIFTPDPRPNLPYVDCILPASGFPKINLTNGACLWRRAALESALVDAPPSTAPSDLLETIRIAPDWKVGFVAERLVARDSAAGSRVAGAQA